MDMDLSDETYLLSVDLGYFGTMGSGYEIVADTRDVHERGEYIQESKIPQHLRY